MENVKILYKKDYILKEIEIPFSLKEIHSQHRFVNYLKAEGVKIAYILGFTEENGKYIEKQERIKSSCNSIDIVMFMKNLANFHILSKKYTQKLYKKKKYTFKYECNGKKLDTLLLHYSYKYKKYPLINLKNNIRYLDNETKKISIKLCNELKMLYRYITKKYGCSQCIIHNDITRNNVISFDDEYFLIDFDMCIKSIELVDISDSLMIKYHDLNLILSDFELFKETAKLCALEYNKHNNIGLVDRDIIYQYLLRIISYNFFVVLKKDNLIDYRNNIQLVNNLVERVNNLYGHKSKKSSCR